mmetsp:Transcript_1711/g.2460  ORF Transcript_1711/g.2460 Transcript_1711/m.2460 type:complete len:302 (-) Transcript_1711:7-912(-)
MSVESNRIYLLIENPSKSNNLGPILRCAAAFSVHQVVFIGYEKCAVAGSHGASKHVDTIAFPTIDQAVQYLKSPKECNGDDDAVVEGTCEHDCGVTSIIGVLGASPGGYGPMVVTEDLDASLAVVTSGNNSFSSPIGVNVTTTKNVCHNYPNSLPVSKRPFRNGNVCFSISKQWAGLPLSQARYCDSFIHIPTVNYNIDIEKDDNTTGALAIKRCKYRMLDPPSFISIALHHYTAWAKYDQRIFTGNKFQVASLNKGDTQRSNAQKHAAKLREEARRDRSKAAEEVFNGNFQDIFSNSADL